MRGLGLTTLFPQTGEIRGLGALGFGGGETMMDSVAQQPVIDPPQARFADPWGRVQQLQAQLTNAVEALKQRDAEINRLRSQ